MLMVSFVLGKATCLSTDEKEESKKMFERFDDEEEEENDVKKQRFRRSKWYWFLCVDVAFSSLIVFAAVLVIRNDFHQVVVSNTTFTNALNTNTNTKVDVHQSHHKYAFTPTNGKIAYSWVAKGHELPSETTFIGSKSSKKSFESESEFKYMHMAMPTELPDGSIAVAFQASPTEYEGSIRQALYWAISRDNGVSFSRPEMIAKDDQLPVWTPVLKVSGQRVFLLYTVSSRKCRYYDQSRNALRHSPGGDVVYKVSDDNGKTWSSGQVILSYGSEDGMPKVIANTLVELEDGSWVLPFWREPGKTCPQMKSEVKDASLLRKGSAGVIRSMDQGLTWEVFGNLTATKGESWLIENTVVERKSERRKTTKKKENNNNKGGRTNNVLVQHFRTKSGVAFVSISRDNGKTWTEASETTLPNPNSKMHTIRIDDGDTYDADDNVDEKTLSSSSSPSKSFFVAAYNHHPRTRDPLVLAVSKSTDGVDSWKPFAKIEPGGMREIIKPELDKSLLKPGAMQYAYPTVHWTKDGKYLLVAYSVMYGARGQLTCFGIRVARMEMKDVPRP